MEKIMRNSTWEELAFALKPKVKGKRKTGEGIDLWKKKPPKGLSSGEEGSQAATKQPEEESRGEQKRATNPSRREIGEGAPKYEEQK